MGVDYFPIRELTPYHKQWTLKARVTAKSAIRTFQKMGAPGGQVFSVDIIDKEGGEIRASFFNEAVTKFSPMLEKGKVYTFQKGGLRVADKRYNQCAHEYEILFNADAKIEAAADDSEITKELTYNFCDIRTLSTRPLPANVDLCGVISSIEAERQGKTRDGRTFEKYAINISDETEMTLNVSLFGDQSKKYPHSMMKQGAVVALKGVVVKEWQGKTGVLNDSGILEFEPSAGQAGERARALSKWWNSGGSSKSFKSLQDQNVAIGAAAGQQVRPCTMEELTNDVEANASLDKATFSQIYCRLAKVITERRNEKIAITYDSCAETIERDGRTAICNRKVDSSGVCAVHGIVAPRKRWLTRSIFQDHTDQAYLQAFDTEFTAFCGRTAEDAKTMSESEQEEWLQAMEWKELVKVTCKTQSQIYEGLARPRTVIARVEKVNFVERGQELLKEIKDIVGSVA